MPSSAVPTTDTHDNHRTVYPHATTLNTTHTADKRHSSSPCRRVRRLSICTSHHMPHNASSSTVSRFSSPHPPLTSSSSSSPFNLEVRKIGAVLSNGFLLATEAKFAYSKRETEYVLSTNKSVILLLSLAVLATTLIVCVSFPDCGRASDVGLPSLDREPCLSLSSSYSIEQAYNRNECAQCSTSAEQAS